MRHTLGNPGSLEYFNKESWLNELSILLLASSTKKALSVGILDSDGNQVSFGDSQTPTSIGDGRQTVTTAGTRVQLSASSVACKEVTVCAETDNTGIITVGGATVVGALATRRGIPLNAGDTITLKISNLNLVYLDTTVNGDGVTYEYRN